MNHKVGRPFKTAIRKFKLNDPITEADLGEHAPMSFDEYKKRGIILPTDAPTPPVMPRKGKADE